MKVSSTKIYFVNKDNNLVMRFVSSYNEEDAKSVRTFLANVHGYGYGFIITKLKNQ